MTRDQHINLQSWQDEAGNTGDVGYAHGHSAHTHRDYRRKPESTAAHGKTTFLNRLVDQNAVDYGPVDYLIDLGKSAFREVDGGYFADLDVSRH
jgi:hypothetical protein